MKNNINDAVADPSLLALLQTFLDGIILLDLQQRIIWWNQRSAEVFHLESNHHLRQEVTCVIQEEIFKNMMEQRHFNQPIEMFAPHSQSIRISIRHTPLNDQLTLLIIQDVSQLYRLQMIRQDLVANVSHELRTPLTVFRGYLELLEKMDELPASTVTQVTAHMKNQCNRMEKLVEDLLLLSRLESVDPNSKEYEKIHLSPLLKNICLDAQSFSGEDQHQFSLELDDTLWIYGEMDELYSAFSNIANNAVQYTPARGNIIIRCYRKENSICVEVEDSGIGIPRKYIARITQRFYRVDKSRQAKGKGGTGLGLSIVKHILQRHQARLEIESEEYRGSVFRCVFLDHP